MRSRSAVEGELVDRSRSGDVAAFEELLRTHDGRMRALAFRMTGTRPGMDDVLQDAYLKAFRIDHARRQRRRREDELPDEPRTGDDAPDAAGDLVTRRLVLRRALDHLDADQRAALLLVDGDGMSYEDAGRVLGVPAGTVSSRLSRARSEMRRMVEEDPR